MLLNLNFSAWAQRIAPSWLGLRQSKRAKRRVRVLGATERLERREMLTTYTVTTLNDLIDSGDGVLSLREAVVAANANSGKDSIQFAPNVNGEINLTNGPLVIDDSVTITGNGSANTIIDAQGNSRVFEIGFEGRDVTFAGVTITGGQTNGEGGGILDQAAPASVLSFTDVVLSNNTSGSAGGGLYFYAYGSLNITDSRIVGNHSTNDEGIGGGICGWNGGILNVVRSEFSANETQGDHAHGGAVYWYANPVLITDSVFRDNKTSGESSLGGAYYTDESVTQISNSLVSENSTTGRYASGGAFALGTIGGLQVDAATYFEVNKTTGESANGGAIVSAGAPVTITYSLITANSVQGVGSSGGAISMSSGTLAILGSTVSNNAASAALDPFFLNVTGGGVNMGNGTVTVDSSTFFNNTTTGSGGGVYITGGRLNVINSTFSGNSGTTVDRSTGGAIGVFSAEVAVDSSTIAYNSVSGTNSAGGGIDLFIGSAEIYNSIIAKNTGGNSPDLRQPQITAFVNPLKVRNSLIGNNLETGLTASANPNGQGNIIGTNAAPIDPRLNALAENGSGPSTHSLQANSPALNRGDSSRAASLNLTRDQNGGERVVGAAVDMGAYELQGPTIASMVRSPGAPNPTSGSSVSFTVTFNESVAGVKADLFYPIVTGTVSSGAVQVSPVSGGIYTLTITGVAGAGTLQLHFESDGSITSTATSLPMSDTFNFNSTETFTIEEDATLAVEAIDFAPGGTSPTTATSVSFKVTFSDPVHNVKASQFHVVTSGTVTSGAPQLAGSGKDYTVTVSGIAGAGTLGLNFQDDGTVVRISDGRAMTAPNFTGAVYQIVEGTQGTSDLDVGGLRFHVVSGQAFTAAGPLNSFNGQVQVGFIPSGGSSFTPLAELNGTVSVNTSNQNFSATGPIKAIISGAALTLFSNGLSDINIAELINGQLEKANGSSLAVAGVTFTLASIRFVASPQPTISLQGSLTLPQGIKVAVDGTNTVNVNSSGVSLNGASLSLTNSFTVGGVTFSADDLTASYTSTGNVFKLTGTASVTVNDIANLSVTFSDTGLVINNGAFTGIDATINGEFNVKGVKITGTVLHFRYSEAAQKFTMSGTAAVAIGGLDANIAVTFGDANSPGIVVTNGSLTSLDMAVTGQLKVSKVTIKGEGLRFTYGAGKFTMSGKTSVTVGDDFTLEVEFGDGTNPGIEVNNGQLQRLDVAVSGEFEISKVKVKATSLRFTYVPGRFSMAGSAEISVGQTLKLGVQFGDDTHPGIVIENGELTRLDVAVSGQFEISKVKVQSSSQNPLRFTWENNTFSMSGIASVTIGTTLTLSVQFGDVGHPGILVSNGELQKLDVKVTGEFEVAKVKVAADGLRFTYEKGIDGPYSFSISGSASVQIDGISGAGGSAGVAVTFGYGTAPGIVITNGTLERLDITIDASFVVKGVSIKADKVRFTYEKDKDGNFYFSLSGSASVKVDGMQGSGSDAGVAVTFGDNGSPGILIENGVLKKLDVKISAGFTVSQVQIKADDLRFTYDADNQKYTLSGKATVNFPVGGFSIEFGYKDSAGVTHPGIEIQNGQLNSIDVAVSVGFSIEVVRIDVTNLRFAWTRGEGFNLSGGVKLTPLSVQGLAVEASLGDPDRPEVRGIVINQDGSLKSLNFTISRSFDFKAISLSGKLSMTYDNSARSVTISGNATLSSPFLGSNATASVKLGGFKDGGGRDTKGLVINASGIQYFDLNGSINFALAGVTLSSSLTLSYSNGRFVAYGSGNLNIPGIGTATATLGTFSDPGFVIQDGRIQSLNFQANANFAVGPLTLTGTFGMTYSDQSRQFVAYGNANGNLLGQNLFNVYLGTSTSPGLIISNGRVTYMFLNLNAGVNLLGVQIGANLIATYDGSGFYFSAFGGITLPANLPSAFQSALGNVFGFQVVVSARSNDRASNYLEATANVLGVRLGFRIDFNGNLTTIGNVYDFLLRSGNRRSGQYGPLNGATVYYDEAANFDLDDAPHTNTGSDGSFANIVPVNTTAGQLVLEGGVDRSTGVENPLRLTAPYDSAVISPLTSLVTQLMRLKGISSTDAILQVNSALGMPLYTDLMGQTLFLEATGGDGESARSFAREVSVAILVHEISALLSSLPGAPDIAEVSTSTFAAIAAVIDETAGGPLDLGDPLVVREILNRAAGVNLNSTIVDSAVTVIAEISRQIDELPLHGIQSYLNRLLQIQVVGQGSIAPDLVRLAQGQTTPLTFTNAYSGATLTTRFDEAAAGPLNVIGRVITITPVLSQSAGADQPATFYFGVFLSSPEPSLVPVTVHYSNRSLNGTVAGVDFETVAGTLTWLPGDVALKTISVPVHATLSELANRSFIVDLSQPVNAQISTPAGVGHIESSTFATQVTVDSSDATITFGDEVTFTSHVSWLDSANTTPNAGLVTFYNGDEAVARVNVENGVARFTTTTLNAGASHIRAVYSGAILANRSYLSSESDDLLEAVAQSAQTITFPALEDVSLDIGIIYLKASSTSGLPIVYRVVSGPGTVAGEVLTLTGAGTVVVEATQPGDESYQSATPFSRTLSVSDSETGSTNTAPVAVSGTVNINPGETVNGQLMATDADNDEITFEIGEQPEHGTVSVELNGTYSYTADADYAGFDHFTFFAIDGIVSSIPGTITIKIGNPNLAPVVNAATLTLPENSANGTTIGFTTATDPNPGQAKTFSIKAGNTDGAFAIESSTGKITVANSALLNFEATPTYALTIEVADNGTPSLTGEGTITITLLDVNEAPTVTAATLSIAENSSVSAAVGTVVATDPDANQSKSFSIVSGNTGNTFAINSTTGVITVANASLLNFESLTQFNLVVEVTDNGTPAKSSTAPITIKVTNVNEAPVTAPATFSVAENSLEGAAVGTYSATDVDVSQTRTFSIIDGNTDGAFFINPVTGAITVANSAALDFEAHPTFSLTIRTTDDGVEPKSSSATVTINLTNVAELPVLAGGAGSVTYQRLESPVNVMPNLTVTSGAGSAALGRIVINVFVQKKGLLSDYSFGNPTSLGTVATSGQTDFRKSGGTHTVTITLNDGVTDLHVQNFLRGIAFNSKKMDAAKKPLGRKIDVQVFDRQGTGVASNVISTQIVARKK